ncbi:MAG: P-type conjugative transfer protein TrbG [Phenylobacterium zucineum]|nr:MAG: P-type conjugative transfer protein TrbG [Phenylobacterium zucineum]
MTLPRRQSRVALAAIACLAFSPLAGPAQAQVPRASLGASTAAAPAPPAAAKPGARRAKPRPAPGYRTVYSANAQSRDLPASGAYVNAALYYAFEPGRLYTVNTSPRFLTVIALRPGEKLISKAAGDTVRWVLGETVQGSGPSEKVLVMLKPTRGGLRTNVILTTDQRTYLLEAVSREGDAYTSVVNWTYALDEAREAQAAKAADARGVVASGLAIDQLHFDYDIRPIKSKPPRWQPLRVFDDGLKTYIQFPTNLGASEAPPLFVIGADKQAQLVNYRYLNGYYVVDRLIDVAELRLGEKRQTVVRITRTGKRS